MIWFVGLVTLAALMVASDKMWENPLAIFGVMLIGGAFWICIGVVIKGLTL